ncbi:HNH endonuclease signature motif containing protein [Corynebacterium variabile]|uniref:HNH endonuclease signature motif containing protein n=1 Tax=Corynebacterium variabile TaxID=1727 RepID=UPI00289F0F55|nr:HNH endonuclease signature motif containing protein [Corynebacterium variabile]
MFDLVTWLLTIDEDLRLSTVLALRGRTQAEAYRYAHAAELAARMPELFDLLGADGRITVDHLDTVWSQINRHLTTLTRSEARRLGPVIDTAVAAALTDWMEANCPVGLEAFALVVQETLATVASGLVAATELAEQDTQRLTKRGTELVLDCGSETTATAVWGAVGEKALEMLREARRGAEDQDSADSADSDSAHSAPVPSMAQCRARVLLDQLGDTPDTMRTVVNLYRTTVDGKTSVGGAFIPKVGYLSDVTAEMLESVADLVRCLPDRETVLGDESEAYRFPTMQRAAMEGRDGHCRFPGCDIPADRCEHDHIVNSWHTSPDSDGPTSVANGMCLCRLHHALKTAGLWSAETVDDGVTVIWTGPAGVIAVTEADGPLSPARAGPDI